MLAHQLRKAGLDTETQKPITVYYEGEVVGEFVADIMINDASYCQMLCMALGGDPFFNNAVNKRYSSDYFSKALRMVQSVPSFLSTAT